MQVWYISVVFSHGEKCLRGILSQTLSKCVLLSLKMNKWREWGWGFRIKFERGEGIISNHFQKIDKGGVGVEAVTFIW